MENFHLDFEEPVLELQRKLEELEKASTGPEVDLSAQVQEIRKKIVQEQRRIFGSLTAWQRVRVARHPRRPTSIDYIQMMCDETLELFGDRLYHDDKAIFTGLVRLDGQPALLIAHRKGRDTKEKIVCNFGMAHPEGYRKAMKKMWLAEKFGIPVVCLIDTPGAYPGIGAEERGQAMAIAENLRDMARLRTPVVCVVIAEGGSGGALGIGVGDRVALLENAYYSVISPEGCASILFRDGKLAEQAAECLKLTGDCLMKLGLIEHVIPEPPGGAHSDPKATATALTQYIVKPLPELSAIPMDQLLAARYDRFRKMGFFHEATAEELAALREVALKAEAPEPAKAAVEVSKKASRRLAAVTDEKKVHAEAKKK